MQIKSVRNLTILAVFCSTIAIAIAERPKSGQKSPWHYLQQMIGDSLVEMEYSRPGVKGREVWGKLVPYGDSARHGAGAAADGGGDRGHRP